MKKGIEDLDLKIKRLKERKKVKIQKMEEEKEMKEKKNREIDELIISLSKSELPIEEQIEIFRHKIGLSIRSFFIYREKLGLRANTKPFNLKNKNDECYFCGKLTNIKHHIDMDYSNVDEKNKLDLCASCHTKLHRIYKVLLKRFNIDYDKYKRSKCYGEKKR